MFTTVKSIALIAALFVLSVSYSQDKTIDSLKIALQNPKLHDTTRIRAISNTVDANYTEGDKNYYVLNNMLGQIVLKNLKKSNNHQLQEKYTLWLASYYSVIGNEFSHKKEGREKGLPYYDKSIALFKSVKSYDEMYNTMIEKAAIYTRIDQDDKAIPLIFSAIKYFEKDKENNVDALAYALSGLGQVYLGQKKHEQAIAFNQKAIHYYDISYAQYPENQTIYLKCLAYSNIAYSYASMKKYAQAIEYCEKTLEISKKIGANTITGLVLSREANAQMKLSNYGAAEKLLKEVLSMNSLSGSTNQAALTSAYLGLGRLYFQKRDFIKSKNYADKGFSLSKQTGSKDLQEQAAHLMYDISKATKNFEKALEMYQFHEKIIDSSQIEASKNALAQQQLQYNFEKKELNLKLHAEKKNAVKNNWLFGLSGTLLLLLLGGFFYYRNNRQKQAIAALEKTQIKQKLLITQMNPHFIFNSIENIRSLIYQNQNNDAVNYLGKFSKLTRQILENSNENYISLEEEVEMTENYLSIQQLLYNNKFIFSIAIAEDIDPESVFLPPMLTQPFIENAIKHGLSNTIENGKIDIRFYLKEAKLFFEVSDNGKGFDAGQKSGNHKSLAMTITKERLVTYTKNHDFVVQTDNIIGKDESVVGAKVMFEIPYIYEN